MGLQLVTLPISLCLTFAAYGLPWLFLGAGLAATLAAVLTDRPSWGAAALGRHRARCVRNRRGHFFGISR